MCDDEVLHDPLTNPVGEYRNTAKPSLPQFPHPGNIQGPVRVGQGESNVGLQDSSDGWRTVNVNVNDRCMVFVNVG
jgi:hypothetical protein